jgi:MRG
MARVKWVGDRNPAPPASSPPSSPPVAPAVEDRPPTPEPPRRSLRNIEKSSANAFETRWDDWVPQDRLRKLTEDNRELAASLRRDVMQAESRQRNPKSTTSKKGRAQGSEIGSGRGSEERHSSVPAGVRGTKRGKDNEIEKVSTPDFLPTPRRSSRMQLAGFSQSTLPNFPDRTPRGSGQDDSTQAEACTPPSELRTLPSLAVKSNKGGTFALEDPPAGRAGTSGRGIKTIALRTIHGRYDEEENLTVSKPEVVSRRGYFKDGKLSSPDLDAATSPKPQAGSRLSRRSERSDQESKQNNEALTMPDEATCTDEEMFEFVMNVLSRPPPPDEPEHITVETFNSGRHWAPLIGGTSESERAQIEEEARQMDLWTPKRRVHPQYEKARINDPLNANRLHFFENQDPERILVTAGVPKDPTNIDHPGSGTPFDALRYPDRLVQLPAQVLGNLNMTDLQQLDRATILRFPNSALRMLAPRSLSKLKIPIPSENDSNDDCFQEEAFYARPSVHFTVPDMIKGYLVDDWENVTKSLTLVELPSKAPVNWVLDTYFHEEKGKRRLGSADADRLVEIIEGMKLYFEKMLGKTLLYKFERGQYAEV